MRFLRASVPLFAVFVLVCTAFFASIPVFAAAPDRIGAIDAGSSVELPKSLHPKARPQYDLGAVDPSFALTYIALIMAPSPTQQSALNQLLAEQQDRKSANYHKWLTPQQFADQFGLSENDIAKVTAWLQSEGFENITVAGGRNAITFTGTAAQVQSAFRTQIHRYKVDGIVHFANSTPVLVPASLNGVVSGVLGLHSFLPHPNIRRSARTMNPGYYSGSDPFPNVLAPADLATIYDINALYTASAPINGTGQKLAIVGQTDVYLTDLNDFRSGFGLPQISGCSVNANQVITSCNSTYFQYVVVGTDTGVPSACGDLSESDLDLEWSGAIAPDAKIVFVNAPATFNSNCTEITNSGGVNAALMAAINPPNGPPLAPVISMSYGLCEAEATSLETVLEQGNTEGVTIMNSAGDQGAAACDGNPPNNATDPPFSPAVGGYAVNYPASSPEVTGVGGTAISLANDSYPTQSPYWNAGNGTNDGSVKSYIPETTWNDDTEFQLYCASPASGDTFCSQGGQPATPGWVDITPTSSASVVQEDIWISSGGGGASNCTSETNTGVCTGGFTQPSWQSKLSVSGAPAGVRYVPDVSMLASPNFPGYIICTPNSELIQGGDSASSCANGIPSAVSGSQSVPPSIIGGTSASSPIFAGIVTLLNQYANSNGVGNLNPALYQLAANTTAAAFHNAVSASPNVTTGTNNVYCSPGTPAGQPSADQCPSSGVLGYSASNFDATTGYNLVTGLGSVDAKNMIAALGASFTLAAAPSTATVSAGQTTSPMTVTVTPVNGFSGTVTFGCSGLQTGMTCNFNPPSSAGTTSLTIVTTPNTSTGSNITVTVTGSSGIASASTPVTLTVSATTETFSLSLGAASYAVAAGSTATIPITVSSTSTPSFISNTGGNPSTVLPVTYTCSGLPSESACNFSPSTTTSNPTLTLSVTTTAPTAKLLKPLDRNRRIFYAALLPGLFGLVFVAGSRNPSSHAIRILSLIAFLGFSTLWLGSCGNTTNSSNSNPGTPAGSYTVTVNAATAGGGTPLTSTKTFTLVVSQ